MVDYSQQDLTKWINEKAMDLTAGHVQKTLLNSDRGGNSIVGNLYFFKYEPKLKQTLDVYDKYPMAFPIKIYRDGFLGVNMHYLPVGERKLFVKNVNEFKSTLSKSGERSKVNAEYITLLEQSKRIYKIMPEAVHRYLNGYTRSRFIKILPEEYDKAVQLKIDEWIIKG